MKVCSICGEKHYAKGLCKKHYKQRPEVKEKQKEYYKKYYQRPEVKEQQKEYRQRPEIFAIPDFFHTYQRHPGWQKENFETIATLYANTLCDLTHQQKCKIQEKIILAGKIGKYKKLVKQIETRVKK